MVERRWACLKGLPVMTTWGVVLANVRLSGHAGGRERQRTKEEGGGWGEGEYEEIDQTCFLWPQNL